MDNIFLSISFNYIINKFYKSKFESKDESENKLSIKSYD